MADNTYSSDFWNRQWNIGQIGFHRKAVNQILQEKFSSIIEEEKLKSGCQVFVPLCGKSVDMKWLADLGHTVIGIEMSPKAIEDFFQEQELEYCTEEVNDKLTVYKSLGDKVTIKIYCGDLFNFSRIFEGPFDFIWDRASLVAINPDDRIKYRDLMTDLLNLDGKYLLGTIEYEKSKIKPPPNSVPENEVRSLYEEKYNITKLCVIDVLNQKPKESSHPFFNELYHLLTHKSVNEK